MKRRGLSATVPGLSRRRTLQGLGSLSLGLAASPALIGPALAAGRTIKIGFVSPETGALALFGEADSFVVGEMRKSIAGGIDLGGVNHPVELVVRDSQSNPSRAAEVAAELIAREQVALMLSSSSMDTIGPVADQCELNGVPCISTDVPWQSYYFGRGAPPEGFEWT